MGNMAYVFFGGETMKKTEPIFPQPYLIEKIWSAPSFDRWGKSGIGEAVLFSGDLNFPVKTENGRICGRELQNRGIDFPFQIKAIATSLPLSVQVHPSGKNEMWYIDKAEDDACVYLGFRRHLSFEEIIQYCEKGTILAEMNRIGVKNGDVFFVPGGMPHAIGGNVGLYEVSDIGSSTYRLYDYGRGRRLEPELFRQNLLADVNREKISELLRLWPLQMESRSIKGSAVVKSAVDTAYIAVEGAGDLSFDEKRVKIKKDFCFFMSANHCFRFAGNGKLLIITKSHN